MERVATQPRCKHCNQFKAMHGNWIDCPTGGTKWEPAMATIKLTKDQLRVVIAATNAYRQSDCAPEHKEVATQALDILLDGLFGDNGLQAKN